jgi:hypothetical protein
MNREQLIKAMALAYAVCDGHKDNADIPRHYAHNAEIVLNAIEAQGLSIVPLEPMQAAGYDYMCGGSPDMNSVRTIEVRLHEFTEYDKKLRSSKKVLFEGCHWYVIQCLFQCQYDDDIIKRRAKYTVKLLRAET